MTAYICHIPYKYHKDIIWATWAQIDKNIKNMTFGSSSMIFLTSLLYSCLLAKWAKVIWMVLLLIPYTKPLLTGLGQNGLIRERRAITSAVNHLNAFTPKDSSLPNIKSGTCTWAGEDKTSWGRAARLAQRNSGKARCRRRGSRREWLSRSSARAWSPRWCPAMVIALVSDSVKLRGKEPKPRTLQSI